MAVETMAVRTLKQFSATLRDGRFVSYGKGQVINNEPLAKELLTLNVPVVPLEDRDATVCPKCGTICSRKIHGTPVTMARFNSVLFLSFARQYYQLQAGEVLQTSDMIDAAKANNLPMETTTGVRCPHCTYLFD